MRFRIEHAVRAALVLMGAVTALPALALVAPAEVLGWSYGLSSGDGMTLALLQHRGALQLLLGTAIAGAALHRPARVAVALGAAASKATFLLLILPDAALRPDLALFSAVFDAICIAVLVAIAARELGRTATAAPGGTPAGPAARTDTPGRANRKRRRTPNVAG